MVCAGESEHRVDGHRSFVEAAIDAGVIRGLARDGPVSAVAISDVADSAGAVFIDPQAYQSRAGYEAPDWQVAAWVSTYTTIAAGSVAAVSGDVERLTGHPATSLTQLLLRRFP